MGRVDGPGRAALTSALPQHPMAVRVDAPGASRSFNSAAAGFGARRAGGGHTAPRACTDCGAARPRSRDCPSGQTAGSGPRSIPLSGQSALSAAQLPKMCPPLPGGLQGAAAIHLIAHAQSKQGHGCAGRPPRFCFPTTDRHKPDQRSLIWGRCLVDT